MDPLFWLAAGVIPVVWSMTQKARGEAAWRAAMEAATRALGAGEVSATADGPRLRATLDGASVALAVRDVRAAARSIATADVVLPADAPTARLYVGWGVTAPPAELAHIPEVDTVARRGFVGRVYVRSDDAAVAERFVETQARALVELRRVGRARALEVLVRGGRLHLALHGPACTPDVVRALVAEAASLRRALGRAPRRRASDEPGDTAPTPIAAATAPVTAADTAATAPATGTATTEPVTAAEDTARSPTAGRAPRLDAPEARGAAHALLTALAARAAGPAAGAPARPDVACRLCGERAHAEPEAAWSRCVRCDAPYHTRCWEVATGCLAPGCVETRALPL